MLYRFRGMGSYEAYDRSALREFIKLYCRKDGSLTEPLEAIQTGIIGKACEGEETFPWVFSTFDCDRFDERVDPAGWDFSAYTTNPVVLWAHDHGIPAIGITEGITAGESLTGRIRFNEREYDEFGWAIGERVRKGIIRAGSVGFRVLEIEWVDHSKNPDEKCDLIFRKQELLEFSICNVPANPFALQKDWLGEYGDGKFSTASKYALRTDSVRTSSMGELGDAQFSTVQNDTGSTAPTSTSEQNAERTGFVPFVRNTERRRQ